MQRSRGARLAYGVAALAVLALSIVWFSPPSPTRARISVGTTYSDCSGQGGVEMVTRTIVGVLGAFAARVARRESTEAGYATTMRSSM